MRSNAGRSASRAAAALVAAAAFLLAAGTSAQRAGTPVQSARPEARRPSSDRADGIDRSRYLEHVKFLASDDLGGRGNGSPGLEQAADYIGAELRRAGLAPGGENGTYYQTFEIVTGVDVGSANAFTVRGPSASASLKLGEDFYPLSIEHDGGGDPVAYGELPLVFAGYGISAPSIPYDDFANVEVAGRAVLVFSHEPQENDDRSPFAGRGLTQHATFLNKAMAARQRGARLVIVVEDMTHAGERASYEAFLYDPQAETYGLPVLRVRRSVMQRLLGEALDLRQEHAAIDETLAPRSRPVAGVSVSLQEQYGRVRRPIRNVIGILRGASNAREAVVVGAHYDHLGLGGRGSMSPDATGHIHNGADDNASGTAGLIEMARVAARSRPPRTLVFAAFAGEEVGLLGSAHYTKHPAVPLDQTIAMVNLDMIGRPNGRVLVSGFENAPDLERDLEAARRASGTRLDIRRFAEGSNVGSSDDASFSARRIPAIAFFSGFHADYHRPGDDWDKLEVEGAVDVTRLAWALTREIASRGERPGFVAAAPPADPHAGAAVASVGGYGPYFGSVPDFAQEGEGVRLAEVREGSPAAMAGLKAGDVLIGFDGQAVKTLYDFTYALRTKRPGDRVDVVVRREGRELRFQVELGIRP